MPTTNQVRTTVIAAATMALTVTLPAHADVRRFTDARNDAATSVDIRSVVVDNSTSAPNKVVVEVTQDDVQLGDSIEIYVDTSRGDQGPEYVISGFTASEYTMRRIERWNAPGQHVPFRCGYSLKIHEMSDSSRAVIPRSCLDNPGRIRVAVKVERDIPVIDRDWARAFHRFFHSVAR